MADRFAINAALERLLDDADTFAEADAALLIASVPLTKPGIPLQWKYTGTDTSSSVEGYSPGHGNVSDGSGRTVTKEGGYGKDAMRVGGYKLIHRPGTILIELMWAEGRRILDEGKGRSQAAALKYSRLTKRPKELRIERVFPITLAWPYPRATITLNTVWFVPWKRLGAALPPAGGR